MSQYTYALIDGVIRQSAIRELYSRKELLQIIPLYINTRFQANYDLGAILVATQDNSNFINEVKQTWYNSTSLIYSDQYLPVIAQHLQQLITIQDQLGQEVLFRFADPLITWHWLNSYDNSLLADILAPIQKWQVIRPVQSYFNQQTIIWDEFINPMTDKKGIQINQLDTPQHQALEQAYQFKLKQKLYQLIDNSYPHFIKQTLQSDPNQIDQWLTLRINEAQQQSIITEQTIGMWTAMCCEYGNDFATDPKGYYQQWLQANPEQQPLPTELKIQAFFAQRPKVNVTNSIQI